MRLLIRVALIVLSGFLLAATTDRVAITATAGRNPVLQLGDYAVYTIGDDPIIQNGRETCVPGTVLYPPFYGMGLDNATSYLGCRAELRWDVEAVSDGLAQVRIQITNGWGTNPCRIDLGNVSGCDDPVVDEINESLHRAYPVRIDLTSMDAWSGDGSYLGRWSFQVAAGEVALGEAELARKWYNGTKVFSTNVSVGRDMAPVSGAPLEEMFGVSTFIWAPTPVDHPWPSGLEAWVYQSGGGWSALTRSVPAYEPNAGLLLANFAYHYSDILFNLYGIVWIGARHSIPGSTFASAMTLIDTSIFPLPGSEPPEDGGGGDGGGDDGGGGTGGDDGTTPGGGSPPASFPWATFGLFVAMAVSVTALVVVRFRWFRRGRGGSRT
ncbi:MAG TPA: hypothetical protein VJ207_02705 [Thermoplasmata archaeon]|nr:hypothetical protein [Thermoplasmata archaeon]